MHVIAEIMMPSTIVWLFLEQLYSPKDGSRRLRREGNAGHRGIEKCFDNLFG